jgi:hypothetical protein
VTDAAFSVLSGNPTAEELAALTAVIEALLEEQVENDRRGEQRGQSAWQRSQRGLRSTLQPGYGAWRSFSA